MDSIIKTYASLPPTNPTVVSDSPVENHGSREMFSWDHTASTPADPYFDVASGLVDLEKRLLNAA
jgi:hypothetical protein